MPKIKTSKEEVLKKVIPVLRKRGVAKSSMSALAKTCGIQKSHFYYYFSDKESLIKEVLSTVHSYFNYKLFSVVNDVSMPSSKKVILIKQLIDTLFRDSGGGCIMANTALETLHLDPIYKTEIQLFFKDFISGLQQLLSSKYSSEVSLSLAEQIVQDIEGGILLMQIYNEPKYLDNAIKRMEQIILK